MKLNSRMLAIVAASMVGLALLAGAATPSDDIADMVTLRSRGLIVPVQGVEASKLQDSYLQSRGSGARNASHTAAAWSSVSAVASSGITPAIASIASSRGARSPRRLAGPLLYASHFSLKS